MDLAESGLSTGERQHHLIWVDRYIIVCNFEPVANVEVE